MADSPVTVRLDETLKRRLGAVAEDRDRTPHYLIKQAVEDYVTKAEQEAHELTIVKERWLRYEKTGSFVPGDEVRAWAASLPRKRSNIA